LTRIYKLLNFLALKSTATQVVISLATEAVYRQRKQSSISSGRVMFYKQVKQSMMPRDRIMLGRQIRADDLLFGIYLGDRGTDEVNAL
jgi:hypothetical protein